MTTETKFDCVFCKEVFEDKADLLVHFRKHGDPNFNTIPKYKSRLQSDIPKNEKTTEENELVGCDVCQEVFPTISKAITHKHKAHPDHDAKYFCPFCGKLFTMKHLYNKHLQTNHEFAESTDKNNFHCDYCEVTFFVPSAMLYHNKFFHRQDTELPAFGQSKKVKTYNQELLQIYYCAFCGEEYNNKVNLHKHMSDDHGDENQSPAEILRCPLCEAIFYHLDAYELHLTFHSTEDMYSEPNEMKEKVTEFSLETVSPIVEKVEEEVEDEGVNSESIDNFLQLVMGENTDNEAPDKIKTKKHKKHKKSKKTAITLDEFLNMNKDVFGDGLNVHGIEEVPTQVVLKKVKGKKILNKPESKMVNADLAKLKKHGIVVKTKSGINPLSRNIIKEVNKQNVISTPNEILSKLMNQGNSQIKIVKKSIPQNVVEKEDTVNHATNATDKLTDVDICKDFSCVNEAEETDNVTKTDTSPIENKTDINDETRNKLQDNENVIENDPNLLNESDVDKVVDDNIDENESDTKTITESNNTYDVNTNTCASIAEEKNTSLSNINSPSSQLSKTLNDSKLDSISDNIDLKETNSSDDKIKDNKNEAENNVASTTLNALKYLSHLITVKPVIQSKTANVTCKSNEMINEENKDLEFKNIDKEPVSVKQVPIEQKLVLSKPLGEHITIKSSKESPLSKALISDVEGDSSKLNDNGDDNTDHNDDEPQSINKNIVQIRKLKIRNAPNSQEKISKTNEIHDEVELKNEECQKKASNLDILKRLTNVTAKSISIPSSVSQIPNIKQEKSQVQDVAQNKPCKSTIDDEIEIFNIDDSDSEDNESDAVNNKTENAPSNLPLSALRHLGKNIVVKSNKQNLFQNEQKAKMINNKTIKGENLRLNKQSPEIQRSINLQNKLKILGENIVVKSSNSSPNTHTKDLFKNFDEDYDDDDDGNDSNDSGSEPNIGKVKITEMHDNNDSDDERESQNNAIVESPNVSNSEHEDDNIDSNMEDDLSDIESQIKSNTLKKDDVIPTSNKNACIENFKILNKDLTIKSLNTKKLDTAVDGNLSCQKEIAEEKPNINKQAKQLKTNLTQNVQPTNKSNQQASTSTSTNLSSFNKKVSTSSNQVNTVKTVKRFQSQTVIEEITTTVTKTIRTVNQSTNEVVQNRCNPKPIIRPQKMINKQPGKELQGTAVRHASPPVGTKIRNATTVLRHNNPNMVRPSNQLVPVRPGLSLPRSAGPNTPVVRKVNPPKCSPQNPAIGKLKISPHALKRPSEESPGHFSCFKKPKDSLINTTDMADCDSDEAMQFCAASQSRSDFSCVTKTVKGKGVVTATQMRSEVSSNSQQQLSKLNNVSGLKIVKTSTKQATQVEEKYEINAAKKNTLDALEKLQKQGLLIKKPRTDDYNDNPNLFSESDEEANDE